MLHGNPEKECTKRQGIGQCLCGKEANEREHMSRISLLLRQSPQVGICRLGYIKGISPNSGPIWVSNHIDGLVWNYYSLFLVRRYKIYHHPVLYPLISREAHGRTAQTVRPHPWQDRSLQRIPTKSFDSSAINGFWGFLLTWVALGWLWFSQWCV